MANFRQIADKVKSIDIDLMFIDISISKQVSIMDLLKSQLLNGELITERKRYTGTSYTDWDTAKVGYKPYVDAKNDMNPNAGWSIVDLCNWGDFFNGFFMSKSIEGNSEAVKIESDDWKNDMLKSNKWYGKEIFQLTDYNLDDLAQNLYKPLIRKRIRQIINS